MNAEAGRSAPDALSRYAYASEFRLLLDDAQEVDVVREYDDLPGLGLLNETSGDVPSTSMVE